MPPLAKIVARLLPGRRGAQAMALVLLVSIAGLSYCQRPSQPVSGNGGSFPVPPPPPAPPSVGPDQKAPDYGPRSPRNLTFEEQQQRRYIADRLNSMVSDSEKLLKLTQELSAKIGQSESGSLSRQDMRTLAEIEKLARQVKQKMQLAAEATSAP